MLERMKDFFESRLEGYEQHQLTCIDSAAEFYPFTASCLPQKAGAAILDLGCGTGLELDYYFDAAPAAEVTGIDLSPKMLARLRDKFPEKSLTLLEGSYFDVTFGEEAFDAAVSVESLHHFTKEEKIPLFEKVRKALNPGGFLILTDYFAASDEEERSRRSELLRLKQEQGICDGESYHFDTPLTVTHEKEALLLAGFSYVTVLKNWGPTYTLKALCGPLIASCGNDCSACPRYVASPYEKSEEELLHTAELWRKIGYKDHVASVNEISCTGCQIDNSCRYGIKKCCEEKGISTCAACPDYPCKTAEECFRVTQSFEPKCREVCSDAEYAALSKAFFEKEKNLNSLRS